MFNTIPIVLLEMIFIWLDSIPFQVLYLKLFLFDWTKHWVRHHSQVFYLKYFLFHWIKPWARNHYKCFTWNSFYCIEYWVRHHSKCFIWNCFYLIGLSIEFDIIPSTLLKIIFIWLDRALASTPFQVLYFKWFLFDWIEHWVLHLFKCFTWNDFYLIGLSIDLDIIPSGQILPVPPYLLSLHLHAFFNSNTTLVSMAENIVSSSLFFSGGGYLWWLIW